MDQVCEAASIMLELKQVKNRDWRKMLYHKNESLYDMASRLAESGWVSSQQRGRAAKDATVTVTVTVTAATKNA